MNRFLRLVDPLRLVIRLPIVHRVVHRNPDEACVICRYVWRRLLAEPGFRERLDAGRADVAAGRTVPYP